MPDSFILTGPGAGTQIEFASYSGPPDFGQKDLLKAAFLESPFTEGALSHEQTGPRKMAFPLILRGSQAISNLSLYDQEALFRKLARPGAVLDLKPQGATTAVRFDVLAGRYEFDYNVAHNREGIRLGLLKLETAPYGYWPTMILLASVASVALPGAMTWAGSIIGDAPGLAKIAFQPTVASNIAAGSWMPDMVALGIHHRASNIGHYRAPSLALLAGASLLGDAFAPASQAIRYAASQNQAAWFQLTSYDIASALEPAHRGRFHAFGWFRAEPSQGLPWYVSLDSVAQALPSAALGSWAAIASVPPAVASGTPGAYGAQPSPAYILAELGDLTLPAVGSGMGGGQRLRLWAAPATSNVGVASPVLLCGGLYLLPADSDFAGIMPRGLAMPTTLTPSAGRLTLDAEAGQALLSDYSLNLATSLPAQNAWTYYRGPLPKVASGVRLELLVGTRKTASGATGPVVHNAPAFASVSVSYRPRFQFLKGL